MSSLSLNDFLERINHANLDILPYNNDAQILASQARNGGRIQLLTGKDLMELNVKREADRLEIYSQHIINLATEYIWSLWDSRSMLLKTSQFTDLANNANHINQ